MEGWEINLYSSLFKSSLCVFIPSLAREGSIPLLWITGAQFFQNLLGAASIYCHKTPLQIVFHYIEAEKLASKWQENSHTSFKGNLLVILDKIWHKMAHKMDHKICHKNCSQNRSQIMSQLQPQNMSQYWSKSATTKNCYKIFNKFCLRFSTTNITVCITNCVVYSETVILWQILWQILWLFLWQILLKNCCQLLFNRIPKYKWTDFWTDVVKDLLKQIPAISAHFKPFQ